MNRKLFAAGVTATLVALTSACTADKDLIGRSTCAVNDIFGLPCPDVADVEREPLPELYPELY